MPPKKREWYPIEQQWEALCCGQKGTARVMYKGGRMEDWTQRQANLDHRNISPECNGNSAVTLCGEPVEVPEEKVVIRTPTDEELASVPVSEGEAT